MRPLVKILRAAAFNQAIAVLHTAREPDSRMAEAGDAETWERMIEAAIEQAEAATA